MEINLKGECAALELRLQKDLSQGPINFSRISDSVRKKINFAGNSDAEGWVGQFSPLTVLYPLLQSEGMHGLSHNQARQFNLAHFFFLIHSIVEDRQLDGQIVLSREEIIFNKYLFVKGLSCLQACTRDESTRLQDWIDRTNENYLNDQLVTTHHERTSEMPVISSLASRAAGRASLGFFGVIGMALETGYTDLEIKELLEAFNRLVVGLQWADDLEDWRQDFMEADDNLLLDLLQKRGVQVHDLPRNERSVFILNMRMMQHGIFAEAMQNARALFADARDRQLALACPTLAWYIQKMSTRVEEMQERLRSNLTKQISATIERSVA